MCDYSLTNVRSRPARVGDKLTVRDFGTGTRGFCAPEDPGTAVCLLPGTELSFAGEVMCLATGLFPWRERATTPQFSVKSIKTKSPLTMTRWNLPTAGRFC